MTQQSSANWLTQFRSAPQFEDRYRALQQIIRYFPADEAVMIVQHGLEDGDSAIRAGSARWLAGQASQSDRTCGEEIWKSIASHWQGLLTDADPDVRFESARGLIQLNAGNQLAAATLAELLEQQETQPAMLAAVLKLFASIRPESGISAPAWSRFLHHEQSMVREAAAYAIGHCGAHSPEFARDLVLLLDDEEPFVREEAARSLGALQVASADVTAALQSAANDEDDIVAETAKRSLQQLGVA